MRKLFALTLIKSISGFRGTIGGKPGDNLTPIDAVQFAAAFGTWILQKGLPARMVMGRDARISGPMISHLVGQTLVGLGFEVVDLGLSTTPTVELAVVNENASGGIILTASHNPGEWNALKLLNAKGEFISGEDGHEVLSLVEQGHFEFATIDKIGAVVEAHDYIQWHIDQILKLKLVDVEAISAANLSVAVDAVNSSGGIAVPALLKALGVATIHELYCTPDGRFPHNPEPLAEHLTEIAHLVVSKKAHLGIVVDPDVDRLALVNEDGSMFGEEYTLVAIADYVLARTPGNTVSNLSSTRALRDVTHAHQQQYTASAVGEVNVVVAMKSTQAVIGGEGNGGIIYPESHYGRDALVGIALFLSHYARKKMSMTQLKASYPAYAMSKNKITLSQNMDVDGLLNQIAKEYSQEEINQVDGVKIDFAEGWVHLRKSNTEPIIRIYSEAANETQANELAKKVIDKIHSFVS